MSIKSEGKKRGFKQHPVELKPCGWCGKIIERGIRSPAQYNKINAHKTCASFWAHYKKSEADSKLEKEHTHCQSFSCGKPLVRRDKEPIQAWAKRRFCDKSCAATHTNATERKGFNEDYRDPVALHLVHYKKGTPEFDRVAALYL